MLCGQLNFAEGRDLLHHLHLLLAAEILEGVLHDPGGAHVLNVAKGFGFIWVEKKVLSFLSFVGVGLAKVSGEDVAAA